MSARVLIIGGYGTFGSCIARRLAQDADVTVIVAGRTAGKAKALADDLKAEWAELDIHRGLDAGLERLRPDVVVHTSGPFQAQGYDVAEACIRHRCHYIDLADGRDFVAGISGLDAAARAAGVLVVSGASSVPALTSAVIDKYRDAFAPLESVDYAIATAQRTSLGLATTRGALSYAGKPFTTLIDGTPQDVYGWQGLHWRKFPGLGWRALGNSDVPDLALFPERYPGLKTIRFYAGLELPVVHLSLWGLSWLVRARLLPGLERAASQMLALSRPLDLFGTDNSGFLMELSGTDAAGKPKRVTFSLTARSGDGPYIPSMPAILMARSLARGEAGKTGAMPCLGLIGLDALLEALQPLDIAWTTSTR